MAKEAERYEYEKVVYEITVEEESGGYFGCWRCTKCNVTGGSSVKDPTPEAASRGAKNNLAPHHYAQHRKSSESKSE